MDSLIIIDATVDWHIVHDAARGKWYGVCPALNLNASGDTQFEMLECAGEAVQLLFVDLVEDEELDAFLAERGWDISPIARELPPSAQPKFDVPFELVRKGSGELQSLLSM